MDLAHAVLGAALKNADQMLKAIISFVDTSGDGKIQYEGGFVSLGADGFSCGKGGGLNGRDAKNRGQG